MAESLVTVLIEQIASVTRESIQERVSLVKNVDKDVKKLKRNLEVIQAVLEDAEKKQWTEDKVIKLWLERLTEVSFEIDNVLDEWNTDILKFKIQKESGEEEDVDDHKANSNNKICFSIPSPFSCCDAKVKQLALRHDIAQKIKDLNQTLAEIASEKDRFNLSTTTTEKPLERPRTTSLVDESEVEGRDEDKKDLASKLLGENSTQHDQGLQIIPVVGMGGVGKTTLAQLVYNDEKVRAHFDKLVWVCVSDPFDEMKVAKAIIESIEGSAPNINELESLMQCIVNGMNQKKFLLVLDDVWTTDTEKWDRLRQPLKRAGSEGSRIVVTTRKEEVAIMMGATNQMMALGKLSEENCWVVFKRLAFLARKEEECKELEEIGRKIADKSKGLPLVAKSLGSLMSFKKTKPQWNAVLNSDLWSLKDKDVDKIFTPFLVSYYDLSAKEKRCFLYCSIFPKDHKIKRDQLIRMWMSQNYLSDEMDGVECFENLAMRSFFQNFERGDAGNIIGCKMHDVVHDFAQFLTKNECLTIEADKVEGDQKSPHEKVRHLTLVPDYMKVCPLNYNESNKRNIRSLFIDGTTMYILNSPLFLQLNCLRSLTLYRCEIKELPSSIGNMKHLRYLDLTWNCDLEELPESLCDLCNLQTLDLSEFYQLRRLPEGIGKLINLRHLYVKDCWRLEGFPKGIGKLTSLRSLDTLFVAENKETHFDIEDLKRLRNVQLEGDIAIRGCRNLGMRDDGTKQLDLKNITQQAVKITLHFGLEWREGSSLEEESALLEHLEPHHNLQSLTVDSYMGTIASPRWMASLLNLKQISFIICKNCEMLPSLGQLPCLEKITFQGMESVKVVGVEFLGISESVSPITFFPKLNYLRFYGMPEWEKWEGMKTAASETNSTSLITIMPCLLKLEIERCPRLKVLPDFLKTTTSLKELTVIKSGIGIMMEEWCWERTGDEWDKISHVPNIEIDFDYVRLNGVFI